VVDVVEARFDVTLQHPLIGAGGELVNLGDRVLCSAPRTEPVGTRVEIRLEDRLQHQLQGRLRGAVPHGRDPQPAQLATGFGDHPLPRGHRRELLRLQIISQRSQQPCRVGDIDRCNTVNAAGPLALVAPDPTPCHHEHGGVIDEVEQIIEPAIRIANRPLVQLRLHPQYPRFRLNEARPRCADVHRRPPALSARSLPDRCRPSPCDRLSRSRSTTAAPPRLGPNSR
jgi:hypothetical protein